MGGWDWSSGTFADPKNKEGRTVTETAMGKGPETKNKEIAIQTENAKAISDAKLAVDNAASQASASISDKKRAIARSRSVYTTPLGTTDQATTARKTLLGQ